MGLPHHVRDLLLSEKPVATKVAASSDELRAFVAVYPFRRSLEINGEARYAYLKDAELLFNARRFEITKEILEQDYDVSEADLLDLQSVVLPNEYTLEIILHVWLDDLTRLDAAWKSDIPI